MSRRSTWVWSWGVGRDGPYVELAKVHPWEEVASELAGRALRYSYSWGLANRALLWLDGRREALLRVPITEEQLKLLDTEGMYVDDDET